LSNKTEVWKQASEVYAEISELSPQQALAHVYGIKNITLDVRDAVITLINSGSQASQFYKDNIAQGFNLGFANVQTFKTGQQLDEYELLEELGSGGMSQVFKAKRINSEQQTFVAIKIFAPKDNSNELLNHFLNEQKILAGLSHLNIIKMLHSGKTDDGITYLVMELIEKAKPIDEFCEQNKLSIQQKITYIAQCAQALSYSHANLIIHRDLKPDNILINQNKELKIVDFGIAKLINKDLSGNKTTIMALTPSYAAPEQINSGSISVKTDIFSLAVVALDLLTSQRPLPKDRLIKSCANDEHYLDSLFKQLKIDKDLKNILRKALEQDSNKRYSSMQSFADDLNNYLANKPVNATAQSWFYRLQKFSKRRSALFATMVSFLVFLLIGSVVGYKQYQQIKIEAKKAQTVKQFILDSFTQTNPDRTQGKKIYAQDLLDISAQKLQQDKSLDAETKFELLQTLGISYGAIGNAKEAAKLLQKSLDIKQNNSRSLAYFVLNSYNLENGGGDKINQLLESINPQTFENNKEKAIILRIKAQISARNSEFKQAMEYLNQTIALNQAENDTVEELMSKRLLAEFYYLQSKPKKAIELLENLLYHSNYKIPLSIQIDYKSDLGTLYNDIGEYDKALKIINQTIAQMRKIYGDKDIELSQLLDQLSGTYRQLGDLQNAQKFANEAYQINLEVLGEDNIRTAASINSLAVMAYQSGDIPKAIELMKKAIQIYEKQQSAKYTDTLELKTNLSALLVHSKRYQEALKIIQEVYNIQKEKLGPTHDSTIYSQQILARALGYPNRLSQAIAMAKTAEKNARDNLGTKNPLTIGAIMTLASLYEQDGQLQQSLSLLNEVRDHDLLAKTNPRYPKLVAMIAEIDSKLKAN
jgi:serine/threonine-protein kinase